jgi:hypothetical protein
MHQPEQTTEPNPPPAPPRERETPPCIAFLLKIVRVLLRYGRQLDDALPAKAAHPHFPALAAGFGTDDVRRILGHVQRGILRAMMLERFLLARAAQNRDIAPTQPPAPAEPADIEALDLKLPTPSQPRAKPAQKTDPHDPLHFAMPSLKELESQVRRREVGRTIAEICLDLGVTPSGCAGATWNDILKALMQFGADLAEYFGVQQRRRQTFQKERDKRSDNGSFLSRDRPREAIRELLGCLIGESKPDPA